MATLKIAAVFADKEEAGKLAKSSQSLVFEASLKQLHTCPSARLFWATLKASWISSNELMWGYISSTSAPY